MPTNCPRCQSPVDDPLARFCPACGSSISAGDAEAAGGLAGAPACPSHPSNAATDLCSRCGTFVCPECRSLSSAGDAQCPACAAREGEVWQVPWENRAQLGLFQGYWQTTKAIMFRPQIVFERLSPTTGKWWDPLSYAMVSSLLGMSGILIFYALIFGVGFAAALTGKASSGPSGVEMALIVAVVIAVFVVAIPIGSLGMAFVWGGVEHLALKILGVKTRGYEGTVRAVCYSHAPMVCGIVPLCGAYAYPVWQLVCRIFGYKGVHRTTGVRATFAVLLPAGLCFGGFMAIYMAAIFAAVAAGA